MSIIISHGSQRFNTREKTKFYGPWVNIGGRVMRLKRLHKTATGAQQYVARFAKRLERLLDAQKKMESHQ